MCSSLCVLAHLGCVWWPTRKIFLVVGYLHLSAAYDFVQMACRSMPHALRVLLRDDTNQQKIRRKLD